MVVKGKKNKTTDTASHSKATWEDFFFSLPRKISRILSIIKDIDSSNLAHSEVSQSKNEAIPGKKRGKKCFSIKKH